MHVHVPAKYVATTKHTSHVLYWTSQLRAKVQRICRDNMAGLRLATLAHKSQIITINSGFGELTTKKPQL